MPKTLDDKRMDAIRRELQHRGIDYTRVPFNIRSIIRETYNKLSATGKAKIEEEITSQFGADALRWVK